MAVINRNYTVTLARNGHKTRMFLVQAAHATEALRLAHQDWYMNCNEGVPNIGTVVSGSDIQSWKNEGKGWVPVPARSGLTTATTNAV